MQSVHKPRAEEDSAKPECEPELPPSPVDRELEDDIPICVQLGEAADADEEEEEPVPDLPPE